MPNLLEIPKPSIASSIEGGAEPQAGFDILRSVLKHKSLFLLGIALSCVIGSLYYARQTPIYESSAKILIVNKHPETITGGAAGTYFNDYMSTHQALIVSPVVVDRAVKQGDLVGLGVDELTGGLRVSGGTTAQGASNILTLSFRGKNPEQCVVVLDAVLSSYQEFLEETYNNMSTSALELMTEARDKLLVELKGMEEQYRSFRENSPLVSNNSEGPSHSRLAMIENERSQLVMKKADLESQLATIQKAKDEGRSAAYLSDLIANLSQNSRPNGAAGTQTEAEKRQAVLLPLIQQEKELLQHFGSNHPAVSSVQLRIRAAKEMIEHPERNPTKADDGEDYVQYLKQELDRIATVQKLLTPIYEQEFAAAKTLTSFELRDQEFHRNMDRTQQLYDGVIAQLQETKLSKDYGGFKADVINPPKFGAMVEPRMSTVALSSLVLGCLLGALLSFAADQIDSGFANADELRATVSCPVIGHIPQFVSEATGVDQGIDTSVAAFHAPRSMETEAYRGLRTNLYFSNRGHDHKVIQVTSPCPSDGKSTIASNLSVCIAQSGKSVLLVDADMRRPRQHVLFTSDSTSGLSTVLALDQELSDTIIESEIENLSLMPAGPVPPDPAELLTSPRFGELINALRERYDYVIVDTGPVLAVSDPSIISAQVDGLILAVRLRKTKRKQVSRATDILNSLKAPVMGVVANALVSSTEKSYGYYYYSEYNSGGSTGVAKAKGKIKEWVARGSQSLRKISAT